MLNQIGKHTEFFFVRCAMRLFRYIPFSVLYRLSDFFSWLGYRILRAHLNVVRKNIQFIFPELTTKQQRTIEKQAYQNFFDIIVETIKSFSLTEEELKQRFIITNTDLLESLYQQNRSVVIFTSHFGNWEWPSLLPPPSSHAAYFVYKRQHNEFIDAYAKSIRSHRNVTLITRKQIARVLIKRRHQPTLYGLTADQYPGRVQDQLTVNFFGRQISCLSGPERMAKQFNTAIVTGMTKRIRRGYYEMTLQTISETPNDTAPGELTQRCFDQLAESIRQQPGNWLWFHRRFKGLIEY